MLWIRHMFLTFLWQSFSSHTDGSSTERGPSNTTASASASNSTSWAHRASAPPRSQPQPQPLHCPGQGVSFAQLSSALLCSCPLTAAERCWRTPGSTARHQPSRDHKHKPDIPRQSVSASPSFPPETSLFMQLFELFSIEDISPCSSKRGCDVQGQRCCRLDQSTLYMYTQC